MRAVFVPVAACARLQWLYPSLGEFVSPILIITQLTNAQVAIRLRFSMLLGKSQDTVTTTSETNPWALDAALTRRTICNVSGTPASRFGGARTACCIVSQLVSVRWSGRLLLVSADTDFHGSVSSKVVTARDKWIDRWRLLALRSSLLNVSLYVPSYFSASRFPSSHFPASRHLYGMLTGRGCC